MGAQFRVVSRRVPRWHPVGVVDEPVAALGGTGLLERASQLDTLRARVGEAVGGRGSLTLVLGEAGVGKSSLVRALADERPRGLRLLEGACDPLSTPRPLAPLHDIALAAGGDLLAVMAGDTPRHDRFAAALAELAAPHPPSVVVIEDVHWADDATRDLLLFLARRIASTQAAVIVTARDDELIRDHPLTVALGRLMALPEVRRMELAPLGPESVATLARGLDANEIYAATGGNPFFVTALIEARATDVVPSSVRAAVLARADALGPQARRALDAAALIPRADAEVSLVLAAAEVTAPAIDECLRSGMLVGRPAGIAFRHDLARRAVEDSVPPAVAAHLHRRLLAELESRGADPARLTHHAERGGDPVRTARYGIEAAMAASGAGAHRSAARQYERALGWDALRQESAAVAWEGLAREYTAFADDQGAFGACEKARAIWRARDRPDDDGRAAAMAATALWRQGRGDEARRAIDDVLAGFDRRADSSAKAVALSVGAQLHMLAREVVRAISLGRSAAELAARFGDDRTRAAALNAVGASLWFVDPDQAEEPLVRSRALAENLGDDIAVASALINLGSGAGEVRRYAQADRWLDQARVWCAERDLDHSADYATAWLARSRFEQGQWSAGAALAESVRDAPGVIARIVALTVIGRIRARSGAPDAEPPLLAARELAERTGDLQRLWPAAAGLAESAWLRSEADRIPALVAETFQLAVKLRQGWAIGELGFWLWRAGSLSTLPSGAAEPFAAQVRGEFGAAAALWEQLGCPYEAAGAFADSREAADRLRALQVFDRLGANPAADAVVARLRAEGAATVPRRPSRRTATNPGGLTARELEVAGLLGEGLTDAALAARLHISPKTAGHHVSAILAKLGVTSRRDVADALPVVGDGERPRQ